MPCGVYWQEGGFEDTEKIEVKRFQLICVLSGLQVCDRGQIFNVVEENHKAAVEAVPGHMRNVLAASDGFHIKQVLVFVILSKIKKKLSYFCYFHITFAFLSLITIAFETFQLECDSFSSYFSRNFLS